MADPILYPIPIRIVRVPVQRRTRPVRNTLCHCVFAIGLVCITRCTSFFLKVQSPWICWVRVRVLVVLMRQATIAQIDGGNALSMFC